MSLMEKQHGKVKSENGVNEQDLMENTKIEKGIFNCCLFLTWAVHSLSLNSCKRKVSKVNTKHVGVGAEVCEQSKQEE